MKTNSMNSDSAVNIGVLGIGGVGGFFGGLLCETYKDSEKVNIVFLSRSNTENHIRQHGLKLLRSDIETTVHPDLITSKATECPKLDYLLCCTKTYDLEAALEHFRSAIHIETIIVPLQNGVNSRSKIQGLFPENIVTEGCVYIVSELLEPGVIEQTGEVHSLYFGLHNGPEHLLKHFEKILQSAKIDGHFSPIIEAIIWEKFVFISSVASLTTFLNKKIGAIREDDADSAFLSQLVDESMSVAIAAGIKIPAQTFHKTMKKIKEMPEDSSSSMQRDYENKKRTEYEALTEYVVELGKEYLIDTPGFSQILTWFKEQAPIKSAQHG